jgi:hypothetical protein
MPAHFLSSELWVETQLEKRTVIGTSVSMSVLALLSKGRDELIREVPLPLMHQVLSFFSSSNQPCMLLLSPPPFTHWCVLPKLQVRRELAAGSASYVDQIDSDWDYPPPHRGGNAPSSSDPPLSYSRGRTGESYGRPSSSLAVGSGRNAIADAPR